jgi:hypothetical protein
VWIQRLPERLIKSGQKWPLIDLLALSKKILSGKRAFSSIALSFLRQGILYIRVDSKHEIISLKWPNNT